MSHSGGFKVVVPARHASSRLPAKPLLDLGGKPMFARVAERARLSGADEIWIATDHPDIFAAAQAEQLDVMMTREDHPSGTDRLAELVTARGWSDDTIVVNVQGDEPLIEPSLIARTARQLAASTADIATVAHPISEVADVFNPNIVKVVCTVNGDALYFSRAPIPYARDHFPRTSENTSLSASSSATLPAGFPALRHVGLYAYRAAFLKTYSRLTPAPIEQHEALEQLRALWHGYRITVTLAEHMPAAGVDTPEDAARMQAWFATQNAKTV